MENDVYNKLIEKVLDRNNLNDAYRRVKRNKGVPGIDGMTVEELGPYLREHRQEIKEAIRAGKYKETPVKRVEIPKPDGSKRQLGIPTVRDRFVQQAVAQVLTPIYEEVFSDNSFGFRPNRSAADAIERARGYYESGLEVVVDIDMSKSKWASIFVKVMEWVMQWGYADMSDQYSNANTTMLAKYKKDHAVDGELNFFLVNGEIVGKGVGSKLLSEAEKDLQGKHIYLYTDDGSTFQFYDKRGFTRVGEKQISMLNGTDSVPLTAMLYAKEY